MSAKHPKTRSPKSEITRREAPAGRVVPSAPGGDAAAQEGENRRKRSGSPPVDLDREWPALPGNPWPPGFTASREQLYDYDDEDGR